ncbi:DNA binding [Fusarium albosuccineum]|uniref:DNA binding n=1 Tax=Fusarium albosuccineum TaxID=1237068 RepID=A0A8H4PCA0_9HYPO|nr:DNA binding [Fusarium albosuccineum]
MVTQIKNVALVGASGNLGVVIQDHFLAQPNSRLQVSVLTRKESDAEIPAGLNVIQTDYSPTSLQQGLRGQDVVIMLLPPESTVDHETVIDAAVKAGVKHFFPSEYGVRTYHPDFANNDVMSWTGLMCNPWVDFCVVDGLLGFDINNREARIYNGGNVPFSTGLRDLAAQALYALVTNPERLEEAKNKYIHVASYTTTQNEVLSVVEKLTGQKWKVKNLTSEEVLPEALEDVKKGKNWGLAYQVQAILYGKGSDGHAVGDFRPLGIWNERLGLPETTLEDDLRGPLAGEWKGILHWQPDELPNYAVRRDSTETTL